MRGSILPAFQLGANFLAPSWDRLVSAMFWRGSFQMRVPMALSRRRPRHFRDGCITLHSIIGKFLCTSVTLASGIPLGPEGPSVAVGAGIASVLGRKLGLSAEKVRALLPVGAAAAISAAFNTPIAAVLFALEEIIGD